MGVKTDVSTLTSVDHSRHIGEQDRLLSSVDHDHELADVVDLLGLWIGDVYIARADDHRETTLVRCKGELGHLRYRNEPFEIVLHCLHGIEFGIAEMTILLPKPGVLVFGKHGLR